MSESNQHRSVEASPLWAMVLSPMRGSPEPPPARPVVYGGRSPDGNSIVVYDCEARSLATRPVTSPGLTAANRRCPLCNSDLSGSSASDPNAYFSSLEYVHKQLPFINSGPGATSLPRSTTPTSAPSMNQFSGRTNEGSDLHDLSSKLMVNGYYSTFFRQLQKLGTGSYGTVFLCQHVIDSECLGEFAVKKIPVGDSREWLRKVMKEVKALERLAMHPNIVGYKHSWLEMHRANEMCPYVPYLFLLMSYCDGGSLEALVFPTPEEVSARDQRQSSRGRAAEPKKIPTLSIWSLFIDVTRGLQHLHRNFVVHRDLKPSNILLTSDSHSRCGVRAVLSDFGTAELVDGMNASGHSGFTGTVEYTAPEVLAPGGQHEYTDHSDMWSLGIVLYAMCFNAVPVHDDDPIECARRIVSGFEMNIPQSSDRDPHLLDLIRALTKMSPSSRSTADDILFHPIVREQMESHRAHWW